MNEIEIEQYMLNDKYISKYFRGVYSSDLIPTNLDKKGIYIINTDPSTLPGKHWVVLSKLSSYTYTVDYFDSYGEKPINEVQTALNISNLCCRYSIKRLQGSHSDVCGDYCVFYAYFVSRGYTMAQFLELFTSNTTNNDMLIRLRS